MIFKRKIIYFYLVVFVLASCVFFFYLHTNKVVNYALGKANIHLKSLTNSLNQGSFSGLVIEQQSYDIACKYQRQSMVVYHIVCEDFNFEANVELSLKEISVKSAHFAGEFQSDNGQTFLEILKFPNAVKAMLQGDFVFQLERATFTKGDLTYLDLTGDIGKLSVKGMGASSELFKSVQIGTLSKVAPIQVNLAATGTHELNLITTLSKNTYQTEGTLKGDGIDKYHYLLSRYATQLARDQWQFSFSDSF